MRKSMTKKIKSWGASKAILFNKEECELYDLSEGDVVNCLIEKDINWSVMQKRVANERAVANEQMKGGRHKKNGV